MPNDTSLVWVSIFDQGILIEETQMQRWEVPAVESMCSYEGYEVRIC